ncbi:MAG: hypothetical protein NVS2B7_10360 [Herpetosiphon sp.]
MDGHFRIDARTRRQQTERDGVVAGVGTGRHQIVVVLGPLIPERLCPDIQDGTSATLRAMAAFAIQFERVQTSVNLPDLIEIRTQPHDPAKGKSITGRNHTRKIGSQQRCQLLGAGTAKRYKLFKAMRLGKQTTRKERVTQLHYAQQLLPLSHGAA